MLSAIAGPAKFSIKLEANAKTPGKPPRASINLFTKPNNFSNPFNKSIKKSSSIKSSKIPSAAALTRLAAAYQLSS
jgi:hypothetical protein